MNSIITTYANTSSLQPFKSVSLQFLQDAEKEILVALAAGYIQALIGYSYVTTVPYVLYGNPYTISGASPPYTFYIPNSYVLYQNSIYKLPSTSIVGTTTSNIGVTFSNYFDPSINPIQFSDLTTHNVHEQTTMQMTTASNIFNYTSFVYPTTVPAQITAAIPYIGNWLSSYSTETTWSGVSSLLFRMDSYGEVHMEGYITCNSLSPDFNVLTMPVGYRPSMAGVFTTTVYRSSSYTTDTLSIGLGGTASISNYSIYTSGDKIFFDGITYFTT